MSNRDWINLFATFGCLALGGGALVTVALQNEPRNFSGFFQQHLPKKNSDETDAASGDIMAFKISVPNIYQVKCDKPEDREDANLCEQVRMAQSAEQNIYWSKWQLLLNTLGFASIVWTIQLSRKSTNAAIKAAEAAESSVKTAQETAIRQLRAYVSVSASKTYINPKKDFALGANVELINAGQTPARDLRCWIGCSLRELPLSGDLADPQKPPNGRVVLGPGLKTHLKVSGRRRFSEEELVEIKSGKKALYIFGRAEYVDVFNKSHVTNFRLIYRGEESGNTGLKHYDTGNDAT